jgi:hypothetical protein
MKKSLLLAAILAVILICTNAAFSIPCLQIYIEGATYDETSDTWVYAPEGSSSTGGANIRLWAIGNVGGPGNSGSIYDVKLSIAYDSTINPSITLTPSSISAADFPGWFDSNAIPQTPTLTKTVSDGSSPILGDGSYLPSHGIFGDGVTWQEYYLGHMTLTDSPIGDFIGSFPSPVTSADGNGLGQINVYDIAIGNVQHGDSIHFDLYDHIEAKNRSKYVFTPFSHDGEGGPDGETYVVPEPTSLLLLGTGVIGLGFWGRRKLKR